MSYLSWAWAWGEFKKRFPASYYTVYENKDELNYHHDSKTAWVKVGVTLVEGEGENRTELEHVEYLPVMDMRNASIQLASITSFHVNKAIQRALVKAIARHGLGLFIYAGEDYPEEEPVAPPPKAKKPAEDVTLSPQAQKLMDKIVPAITEKTANMSPEEKKAFAAELKSLVGQVNYRTITDVKLLQKLYDAYVKE